MPKSRLVMVPAEIYHIEMASPSVVYVSAKETKEDTWGFVQFPFLRALPHKTMLLGFQVALDSFESYGKDSYMYFISDGNAKEWRLLDKDQQQQKIALAGLPVDENTIISVETVKAPKIDTLALPSKPFTWIPYDYSYSQIHRGYRFEDLPAPLNTISIRRGYLNGEGTTLEQAPVALKNDFRMEAEGLLPVIFVGPIKLIGNNKILGAFYTSFAGIAGAIDIKEGLLLLQSDDGGKSWFELDRFPYKPDVDYDPKAYMRGGFTEPTMEVLEDGSYIFAFRTADATPEPYPGFREGGPLYTVRRSSDGLWNTPRVVSPYGVLPQLLRLKNGMLVLSYGRPGVQVRLSVDNGNTWMAPFDIVAAERRDPRAETCGYSSLLPDPNDKNAFFIAYSNFVYTTDGCKTHKAIIVQHCIIQGPYIAQTVPEDSTDSTEVLEHNYHELQKLAVRIRFRNNILHGNTEGFYQTGIPSYITPYRQGQIHGMQRFFAPEGYLMQTVPFVDGARHGVASSFDKNGNILQERFYWHGDANTKAEFVSNLRKKGSREELRVRP